MKARTQEVEELDLPRQRMDLHIPAMTIVKVFLSILLAWALLKLWPGFLLLVISTLLAITLAPLVSWFEKRGLSRGSSVLILVGITLILLVLFGWLLLPQLSDEFSMLLDRLPNLKATALRHLKGHEFLAKILSQVFDLPTSPEVTSFMSRPLAWGTAAITAVAATAYVLVFTFYLLSDGKGLYAWFLAFVPRRVRPRMAAMLPEVEEVVAAYVSTQFLTSVLFAIYVAVVLASLGVPAVAPLALLAAACDVIPVIGIVISTVPAVLLGLSVSPMAGLGVFGLYFLYHVFETYVLVPKLYGKRLRLSPLAVLLALVIGGTLQGVLGAVLILPFVAAYPVIERHLLHRYLNPEVIKDHTALEGAEKSDKDDIQEAVLRGEKHAPAAETPAVPPPPDPDRANGS